MKIYIITEDVDECCEQGVYISKKALSTKSLYGGKLNPAFSSRKEAKKFIKMIDKEYIYKVTPLEVNIGVMKEKKEFQEEYTSGTIITPSMIAKAAIEALR